MLSTSSSSAAGDSDTDEGSCMETIHTVRLHSTETLTLCPPDFLGVTTFHCSQQPFSAEQGLTTGGVSILLSTVMDTVELRLVPLVVSDEAAAAEEAVSAGQVCCRLPAGIS